MIWRAPVYGIASEMHSISVIEWPEHADGELPEDSLKITIKDAGNDIREITIEGKDEKDWDYL